jgi:hypothetical protein
VKSRVIFTGEWGKALSIGLGHEKGWGSWGRPWHLVGEKESSTGQLAGQDTKTNFASFTIGERLVLGTHDIFYK